MIRETLGVDAEPLAGSGHSANAALPSYFARYRSAPGVFDELRSDDGTIREHWRHVEQVFAWETPANLERRRQHAARLLHENGTTYNVFTDSGKRSRPWEVDLLPLVLPEAEWQTLSAGIAQRARLLSLILADIYGPQRLVREGYLPAEVVFAHPQYQRAFHDLPVRAERRIVLSGTELARSPNGGWWVMADRTEAPAGAGYALENRIVFSSTWPQLIQECHVHRLAPFFMCLQQTLAELSPRATENPRIVLLTEGPANRYYFEDVYLSRYLGYMLVEGGDLAVRSDRVFIKTLDGLLPVDVIFSRVRETALDPLELGGSSSGTAGLLHAIRCGHVALANAPGCGFVESPVLMAFLPGLCRLLLGEELQIPSIATWWCGGEPQCRYVLEHLDELVIKPAFQHSGGREIFGDRLTREERQQLSAQIAGRPGEFVAQELIARSSAPVWKDGGLHSGHVALRAFAVASEERYEVMRGALVRVASDSGPMQLSISAGEGSKDLWVLSSGPVEKTTLLPPADAPAELRRSSAQLPSRAADNLYWLGRHLERAEMSARLLRTVVGRLSSESETQDESELPALLRVVRNSGPLPTPPAIDGSAIAGRGTEDLLFPAMFDVSEPSSLAHVVAELVRIGSIVRDRLSHDTWRAINRLDERFFETLQGGTVPPDEALSCLNQLIIDVAVCSGLIGDGMVRGPAWRFLDMGRRIERALQTCRLLAGTVGADLEPSAALLAALLDVMDSKMTYRSRYLAALRVVPVLDLLIADETNPRSLAYQVTALSEHLDAMPRERNQVGLNDEQKCVASALHELRMGDLHGLVENSRSGRPDNLAALFSRQQALMTALSDGLSRKYLVHSGVPHPLHEPQIDEP